MKPRVFVSSVINGFEEFRKAVRHGIEDAGGEPVLVNEDFPALATSSRNACLDGVDSSDIYIVIVGERGGWRTPSGKLVVEEEYEQARKRKIPVLAFIQDIERDEDAKRLVASLSDYVNGVFRPNFKTLDELHRQVLQALTPTIQHLHNRPVEGTMVQQKLIERFQIQNESRLRFVLSPEREEEVIDIVKLDTPELKQLVFELGHARGVGLLSYEHSKSTEVRGNSLVILQADSSRRRNEDRVVRLEITSDGLITIDANVTGRVNRGSLHGMGEGFVIVESDVIEPLTACFAFANSFYNSQDPYKRHQRFLYNAALADLGYRKLVAEYKERGAMTFANNQNEVVTAFDRPRLISREDLSNSGEEIGRIITLFRRQMKQ